MLLWEGVFHHRHISLVTDGRGSLGEWLTGKSARWPFRDVGDLAPRESDTSWIDSLIYKPFMKLASLCNRWMLEIHYRGRPIVWLNHRWGSCVADRMVQMMPLKVVSPQIAPVRECFHIDV